MICDNMNVQTSVDIAWEKACSTYEGNVLAQESSTLVRSTKTYLSFLLLGVGSWKIKFASSA